VRGTDPDAQRRCGLCHPEAQPKDLAAEWELALLRPRSFTPLRSIQDEKQAHELTVS
jgi:hypothetical protein